MKKILLYTLIAGLTGSLIACRKDNQDAPASRLYGKLVYQGTPIEVEYDRVPFELFQYGFGRVGPINGTFAPDGSYSHLLFNGEYKMLIRPGQGPFLWPQTGGKTDSLTITMNGDQELNIEVRPYHMIRNPQITGNATSLQAKFHVEKIIKDSATQRGFERVSLYVNKTNFVSGSDNIAVTNINRSAITDTSNINISVNIPAIVPAQNYVFGRIGVKVVGVEDMIFSPVVRINF